jgi:2-dehydro-3-deoxyphosphogluconate aldolase/(4S)-4-hydroxy-2-oxoglutarate aldolase
MTTNSQNVAAVLERLSSVRIIPVLVLNSLSEGLKICELLQQNGLQAAEITFRTSAAADIIRAAAKEFPELLLGAGTVLNLQDLQRARDAGASFAVAPGFNPKVVSAAIAAAFPFAPGICTPSEIEQAVELGCRLLKYFPAEAAGGVKMLKSLIAPYRHLGLRYMPTGGISSDNALDYLALPEVAAVGGTWLVRDTDLKAGNWELIAANIRSAAALLNQR